MRPGCKSTVLCVYQRMKTTVSQFFQKDDKGIGKDLASFRFRRAFRDQLREKTSVERPVKLLFRCPAASKDSPDQIFVGR